MSEPRGHHFLPRRAYLQFFSIPGRADQIYLYRRGRKSPVVTNLVNIAKKRDLYAVELGGKTSREWETRVFSKIDRDLVPVFSRLNEDSVRSDLRLTITEMEMLVGFIAYQFLRTPTFRDNRRENSSILSDRARRLTPDEIKELRRVAPRIPSGVADTDEEFAKLWAEAVDQAQPYLAGKRSWLANMPEFAERISDELWAKSVALLTVASDCFVTCDQPVVMDYNLGFRRSEVLFPVGSHRLLLFDTSIRPDSTGTSVELPIRVIDAAAAALLNNRVVASAESEVYSAFSREDIQQLLNATAQPQRFAAPDVREVLGIRAK